MPRNHSESHPAIRCPEAINYVEAIERWLDGARIDGINFCVLWNAMPWAVSDAIVGSCGKLNKDEERRWRKLVAIFIRSHYTR